MAMSALLAALWPVACVAFAGRPSQKVAGKIYQFGVPGTEYFVSGSDDEQKHVLQVKYED